MKPHRQIRASKTVGDPSSKFAYNKDLDQCVQDKQEVIDWAENKIFEEIEKLMLNQIVYPDGVMSQQQKWKCIVNASLKLKSKYNL
jgi:hypothetical protein